MNYPGTTLGLVCNLGFLIIRRDETPRNDNHLTADETLRLLAFSDRMATWSDAAISEGIDWVLTKIPGKTEERMRWRFILEEAAMRLRSKQDPRANAADSPEAREASRNLLRAMGGLEPTAESGSANTKDRDFGGCNADQSRSQEGAS